MLDILFPRICLGCNETPVEKYICRRCIEQLEFISGKNICHVCGQPFGFDSPHRSINSNICASCIRKRYSFRKCRSVLYYNGQAREFLHNYKYNGNISYSGLLITVATDYFPGDFDRFDMLIPVPVHINKLRKREFNQSAVISSALGKFLGIESNPFILKKTRDTIPQVDIGNEKERARNVKGSFSVVNGDILAERNVLLVDDVFTTGSTTEECSRTVLKSGAASVQVFTLMRAAL